MNMPTTYIILTETGVDRTASMNKAFEMFVQFYRSFEPCRVIKIEFDVETGAHEASCEMTGDFTDALQGVAA